MAQAANFVAPAPFTHQPAAREIFGTTDSPLRFTNLQELHYATFNALGRRPDNQNLSARDSTGVNCLSRRPDARQCGYAGPSRTSPERRRDLRRLAVL